MRVRWYQYQSNISYLYDTTLSLVGITYLWKSQKCCTIEAMQEFTFTLPEKIHTHTFYDMDYVKRNELVTQWLQELHKSLVSAGITHTPNHCSNITFDFYFTGQILSVVECTGMVDIILQVLVESKVLTKGTYNHIGQVTIIPNKSTRRASYCVVELD